MRQEGDNFHLQLYATSPAPKRDYHGLTITSTHIILNSWDISHGPHVYPQKRRLAIEQLTTDPSICTQIKTLFGKHVLEYIRRIARKDRSLLSIPEKLLREIVSYLAVDDIIKLGQTSKIFFEMCNTNFVWKIIYQKKLSRPLNGTELAQGNYMTWRHLLQKQVFEKNERKEVIEAFRRGSEEIRRKARLESERKRIKAATAEPIRKPPKISYLPTRQAKTFKIDEVKKREEKNKTGEMKMVSLKQITQNIYTTEEGKKNNLKSILKKEQPDKKKKDVNNIPKSALKKPKNEQQNEDINKMKFKHEIGDNKEETNKNIIKKDQTEKTIVEIKTIYPLKALRGNMDEINNTYKEKKKEDSQIRQRHYSADKINEQKEKIKEDLKIKSSLKTLSTDINEINKEQKEKKTEDIKIRSTVKTSSTDIDKMNKEQKEKIKEDNKIKSVLKTQKLEKDEMKKEQKDIHHTNELENKIEDQKGKKKDLIKIGSLLKPLRNEMDDKMFKHFIKRSIKETKKEDTKITNTKPAVLQKNDLSIYFENTVKPMTKKKSNEKN